MRTGGYQEQRRRPSRLLTLAIASIASVVAAIFTSEIWDGGVVGTAAVTPVIVALVTDLLHPLARGRGEWREQEEPARPAPRRPVPVGAILAAIVIGLVAFVIAAVALTVPEVLADKSITGEVGHTTYFGDNADKPWGANMDWGNCLDDVVQCVKDILGVSG